MANLHDRCVLVTRPDPQGSALCQFLIEQGTKAIHFPTIAFAPPPDTTAFEHALTQLDQQDWLIFNSPQAVRASTAAIRRVFPSLPATIKIAAIGEGTKQVLEEAGWVVNAQPASDWSSEGLLNMPVFQAVQDKKIAIIRGVGGRELLDKTLLARGAQVLPVLAYQRVLPPIEIDDYLPLLTEGKVQAIICTSFEGVQHLKILFGPKNWQYINTLPLMVVSERIKILARDLGFQTIWVARNASHLAILEILKSGGKT